jgi:ABC-2 type transport system ATP-binding protein
MEEAERLCDRVAIVDRGKVIALGRPDELIAGLGGDHVIEFSVDGHGDLDVRQLTDLPTVSEVTRDGSRYCLSVKEPHRVLPSLIGQLYDRARDLSDVAIRHASLDDVFVRLAGRHLEGPDEAEES